MAKKKADKKKGAAAAPDDPNAPPKKKGGLIATLVTPLVLGGVAFGTVYFLPEKDVESHVPVEVVAQEKAIDIGVPTDMETISLSVMTVSIGQNKQVLRIGITLEAPAESISYISPDDPRLRDAFMGYLRAIEVSQLQDAAFMAQLRSQLLRRAKLVLGAENVYGVLITDFLVR